MNRPSAEVLARNLQSWKNRPLLRSEISDLVTAELAGRCGPVDAALESRLVDLLVQYQRAGMRVSRDVISTVLRRQA